MALQDERDDEDEKNAAKSSGPRPKNISAGDEPESESEFERFERLTRTLVNTPKPTSEKKSSQ